MIEKSESGYNPLSEFVLLDLLGIREILIDGNKKSFEGMMTATSERMSSHILNSALGLDINTDDDLYRIGERLRHYTKVSGVPCNTFPFREIPHRFKPNSFLIKSLILSEGYIYEPCSEMRLILPRIGGTTVPTQGEEYYRRIQFYWECQLSDSTRDIFGRITGADIRRVG